MNDKDRVLRLIDIAVELGKEPPALRDFNPDQPRDDHGKFAATGSSKDKDRYDDGLDKSSSKDLGQILYDWQETAEFEGGIAERAITDGTPEKSPLVMAIRSETYNDNIYRGMFLGKDDPIISWKPGDEVQIMPSSFSTDKSVASKFASGELQGLSGEPDMVSVVLRVSPKQESGEIAHGIVVGDRGNPDFAEDREVITGGTYKVVKASTDSLSVRQIFLRQVKTF